MAERNQMDEKAQQLGFKDAQTASKLAELLETCTAEELEGFVASRRPVAQPESASRNPERRRQQILENRENAPSKERVQLERSQLPGARRETLEAKAYLRTKYTNQEGELVCQCCRHEMPFKLQGLYYFEAVQYVQLDKHFFENRLALCPVCAAMFKFANETDDASRRRDLKAEVAKNARARAIEVSLSLAGRSVTIRFVGTHAVDLDTVIQGQVAAE
jgi:hypothetical protein